MQMTRIVNCNANNCVYNKENVCHTMAINVGDDTPICDTFMTSSSKGGFDDIVGGIGSCKVRSCRFNKALECIASGVNMSAVSNHVDCTTYESK